MEKRELLMNKKCDHIVGVALYDDPGWLCLESRGVKVKDLCSDYFIYCPECGADLTEIDVSKLPKEFKQPIKIFDTKE